MESSRFERNKQARLINLSSKLASCTNDTSMDFFLIIDLSRPLNTNLNVKFAPLWNVMRSCFVWMTFYRFVKIIKYKISGANPHGFTKLSAMQFRLLKLPFEQYITHSVIPSYKFI